MNKGRKDERKEGTYIRTVRREQLHFRLDLVFTREGRKEGREEGRKDGRKGGERRNKEGE